jgi:hypothetical protein
LPWAAADELVCGNIDRSLTNHTDKCDYALT